MGARGHRLGGQHDRDLCVCLCVFLMAVKKKKGVPSEYTVVGIIPCISHFPLNGLILCLSILVFDQFSCPQTTDARTFSEVSVFMGC